jgi:transposase
MVKPLDKDLRVRVVGAVREGMSRHASAARFGVSAASAIRWCQLEKETGSVEPKPMGGPRPSKLLAYREFLLALVKAEPDLTITEIRGRLAKRGVIVGHATVWRFLDREKLSFKKNTARRRAGSAGRRPGPPGAARKAA